QSDADGDGAGDACDPCPLDAFDDADGDGACAGGPALPGDVAPPGAPDEVVTIADAVALGRVAAGLDVPIDPDAADVAPVTIAQVDPPPDPPRRVRRGHDGAVDAQDVLAVLRVVLGRDEWEPTDSCA